MEDAALALVDELRKRRIIIDTYQEAASKIQKALIHHMKLAGVRKLGKGTLVEPMTEEVDWEGVAERVSDEVWQSLLECKPSKQLLEDAIGRGVIKREDVADCIKQRAKTPYVVTDRRT